MNATTTRLLCALLIVQAADNASLIQHIRDLNRTYRMEMAALNARLADPQDDGFDTDPERCDPCWRGQCRYHRGLDTGIAALARIVAAVADDPDLMAHVDDLIGKASA